MSLGNQGLGKIPGPGFTCLKIPVDNYLVLLCDRTIIDLNPLGPASLLLLR